MLLPEDHSCGLCGKFVLICVFFFVSKAKVNFKTLIVVFDLALITNKNKFTCLISVCQKLTPYQGR